MLTIILDTTAGRNSATVTTIAAAVAAARQTIEDNDLGASQLARGFGAVTRGGQPVAHISYNGRVWEPAEPAFPARRRELLAQDIAIIDAAAEVAP